MEIFRLGVYALLSFDLQADTVKVMHFSYYQDKSDITAFMIVFTVLEKRI
jgi:hypothetical protein